MFVPSHLRIELCELKGKKLIARKNIKKGQKILRMSGYITDEKSSSDYALQIDHDKFLDSKKVHLDDYINHSCEPNCIWKLGELSVVALRDIFVGEEITTNYNTAEYDMSSYESPASFVCKCNTASCVGYVRGYRYLNEEQKRKIDRYIFPYLKKPS